MQLLKMGKKRLGKQETILRSNHEKLMLFAFSDVLTLL